MEYDQIQAGMSVRYHNIIGCPHDGKVWTVVSKRVLRGRPMVWLEGKSGGVSIHNITHVSTDVADATGVDEQETQVAKRRKAAAEGPKGKGRERAAVQADKQVTESKDPPAQKEESRRPQEPKAVQPAKQEDPPAATTAEEPAQPMQDLPAKTQEKGQGAQKSEEQVDSATQPPRPIRLGFRCANCGSEMRVELQQHPDHGPHFRIEPCTPCYEKDFGPAMRFRKGVLNLLFENLPALDKSSGQKEVGA